MKKLLYPILLLVGLTACSDYPTSGKFYKESSEDESSRNQVTFNTYSGFIIELDRKEISKMLNIAKDKKEYFSAYNTNPKAPLPAYLDQSVIDVANSEFERIVEERRKAIRAKNIESQEKLKKRISELEKERASLEVDKLVFDEFTKTLETQIKEIEDNIDSNKESTDNILDAVLNKTNEIIVNKDIPRKPLSGSFFSLRSKTVDYSGSSVSDCRKIKKKYSTQEYAIEKYIVIDQLKNDKKCLYINRPVNEVVSDEYDKFVIEKYQEMSQFDNKELESKLKPLKSELKKAAQIASNKTGKSYTSVTRDYEKNVKSIERLKGGLNTVTDDLVEKIAVLGLSLMNPVNFEKLNLSEQTIGFVNDALFINPSLDDAKSAHRRAIENAFQDQINAAVENSFKNVTEVDSDGEFSGLNGSFGPMVALLDIEGSLVKGNSSTPVRLNYVEYIDIADENHVLAKSSDLDLVILMSKVKQSRSDQNLFNRESLAEYVSEMLKRVN